MKKRIAAALLASAFALATLAPAAFAVTKTPANYGGGAGQAPKHTPANTPGNSPR